MPWFCRGCGRRMGSPVCKKKCREAMDDGIMRGNIGADRVPPLDGMVFINDGGGGVPRWAQDEYDQMACKKGKHPKYVQGPRPPGWDKALKGIAARAAVLITGGLPEC
ncbi:hypothetical protein LCGC14_1072710 [marine sediment metagenome]|uniref:Uncharacterized protein n=1 Tax=marine sediment metagenome TaxID=412755 RepID=A0A0F9MMP6_9ZZZZ